MASRFAMVRSYVAEISRILRYDNIEANLSNPPKPVIVTDKLPREGHHGWKYIAFGPDGWLYVPVGAPCNVCEADPNRYAAIFRMKPDGSQMEVFARGVRNTVGFDWHPQTKELWFSDNGRDMLGDDLPSCELNRAPKAGLHFGFPYCHQGDTPDPEFGAKRPCSEFVAPEVNLGAHVAPLGVRFYTGKCFPANIAIACLSPNMVHGIAVKKVVTKWFALASTTRAKKLKKRLPRVG